MHRWLYQRNERHDSKKCFKLMIIQVALKRLPFSFKKKGDGLDGEGEIRILAYAGRLAED